MAEHRHGPLNIWVSGGGQVVGSRVTGLVPGKTLERYDYVKAPQGGVGKNISQLSR